MKVFAQIAQGKVCGYEANSIPTWQEALLTFDTEARVVWNPEQLNHQQLRAKARRHSKEYFE